MKSLKLALMAVAGTGVGACIAVAGAAYVGMTSVERDADAAYMAQSLTSDILPPPLYLVELRLAVSRAAEGNLQLSEAKTKLDQFEHDFHDRLEYWKEHPVEAVTPEVLQRHSRTGGRQIEASRAVLQALAGGAKPEEVAARLKAADAAYQQHHATTDEIVKAADDYADRMVGTVEKMRVRVHAIVIAMAAAALALLSALGFWIGRGILARIGAEPDVAAEVAHQVAAGNLAVLIDAGEPVQDGSILAAMVQMCGHLREMVQQVRDAADHIATGSREIAAGNADLSYRTEQQASNLQATAASMEQLRTIVRNNTEAAIGAAGLAASAAEVARQGGDAMAHVVATMQGIADSSRRIDDIVGVIDGIAFRTNILALNAAVEAARAGEQGDGFAVVASEVRSLAQRSAQAAREIRELIGASTAKVENGAALIAQAGATVRQVVEQAQRMDHLMSEIRSSSVEQSSGIDEIAAAVISLDRSTQQNAALVEQSAAAAESLRGQADELARLVSRFHIETVPQA